MKEVMGIFGFIVIFLVLLFVLSLPARADAKERQARFFESAVEQGFIPVPESEISSVAKRVHALLQPPVIGYWAREEIAPVFSGTIGGRDVFLCRGVYTTLVNPLVAEDLADLRLS